MADQTANPNGDEGVSPAGQGRALEAMAARLAEEDGPADEEGVWPSRLWAIITEAGANRWALPARFGGQERSREEILERYARVAKGSLAAAFILTQHDAAVRRLVAAAEETGHAAATRWLEAIGAGRAFTTVGISQLTTSRRRGTQSIVASERADGGYQLDGFIPWVTAAARADVLVIGAVLADGRQLLVALPTDRPGLTVCPPFELAALQMSCTSEVACEGVPVVAEDILGGPVADVLASPRAAGTGGLETSALALGQARAALRALEAERPRRADLEEPVEALAAEWEDAWAGLLAAARQEPGAPEPAQVRSRSNALVLRITQAYLTARKGTGFLRRDPAQRWARQALFFLVWSCPAPVAQAAIRDLAGLCGL